MRLNSYNQATIAQTPFRRAGGKAITTPAPALSFRKCRSLVRIGPVSTLVNLDVSMTLPHWEKTMESKTEGLKSTTYGLSRLVLQDLLDLLHDLGSELGQDLEGLAVVRHLLGLGSSEDTGRDVFVLHH